MNRLASKVLSSVLACAVATSLASCGPRAQSALPPSSAGSSAASEYTGPLADAVFRITIPGPKSSSAKRRPLYVSSATKSLKFQIVTASALTAGQITSYNARPWSGFDTGTLPNATCPASGPDFVCTVPLKLPPGTDKLSFNAYDATGGTGNILSGQVQTLTVVAGTTNSFNVVLDANITTPSGSMTVNGSGSCQNGPVGAVFGSVGTTPITFTVAYTDAQNKTIVSPGLPKLQIQDNTSTWQSASGTINGTGGTVGFTITQSTQTFVLTPSNSSTTNASVNVRAIQADSNVPVDGNTDGLGFTKSKTFAFSTGAAPPSHNFLGAVEQTGAASGKVDFFNVTLGGSGGPDSLSAFSPAFLAVTASNGGGGPNDVDNPLALAWDTTGDLLIANSGDGGVNHGNMACVPVGAISTGANASTTVSTNVTVPVAIAYDGRDGTVALADNTPGATYNISEYLLTGNYVAASAPRNLKVPVVGDNWVASIQLAALSIGTFAGALTDGVETDSAHNGATSHPSKIALFSPNGTETDIDGSTGVPTTPVAFAVDNPTSLAWDQTNSQLVITNGSVFHKNLSFYTIGGSGNAPTATQTKVILMPGKAFLSAVSPDGHVAVVYNSSAGSGAQLIQVFDNTASRNPVGGPIPYNGTTDAGTCSNYTYPLGSHANSITWLSNSKLLVAFESLGDNTKNGLYIYDISSLVVPTGFPDNNCSGSFAAAPKQTAFTQFVSRPVGTAFKP